MYRHINVSQSNDVTEVRFSVDRINTDHVIANIGHDFDLLIRQKKHVVIINFRGVKYFTSGMTNNLLLFRRKLQEVGGKLRLCNLSESMIDAFKSMRLIGDDPVFEVKAGLEEAITTVPWDPLPPPAAK